MRAADGNTESMFTMSRLDDFVAANHPLRPIRQWLNDALTRMDPVFSRMYESDAKGGRPSIAPEKLIRALLLQVLYSIRCERMLMEQISYNMLFRWFVGLAMDDVVWDHSTFRKNRDRLMPHDVMVSLFNETVETARVRGHLPAEHFSVDGTLSQAWAGHKSFVPKANSDDDSPPNGGAGSHENWHGEKRSNDTHESSTDSRARLFRKSRGTGPMLCYMAYVLTDNRHGLVVNAQVTQANGTAERDTAAGMLADAAQFADTLVTVGADKNYDTADFVATCRAHGVTPHVAQNNGRADGSAIDARTTRWAGYAISRRKRKCIEQVFGWSKTFGRIRQAMFRGLQRVGQVFLLTHEACNLTRMRTLAAKAA
ncbi:transposase [Paraburkholderia tropica]|uniref:IS4 family transposase n=1 Tax=Paraburkholderia tropica TaxID=92647 RepID=A0ABX5ME41_9BURK|nr:IS5 family transposase [Paraburkholderia tropica]MBB3005362.1 transposase [Paraburkholderia tropica]MBB6323540.1 transposase [Paraburkholderia tropica]PXX02329.1 IS4 family transposase [Paraburkholderia tropica]PZW69049.1 IS4 family transposase [Paraburkholderia tropica]QNB17430.1 IS5 family transposase [Paraburkholderia tropica]